jgi:hypothetical protein
VLFQAAEVTAQVINGGSAAEGLAINLRPVAAFAAYGMLDAPMSHYWFGWVARATASMQAGRLVTAALNLAATMACFDGPVSRCWLARHVLNSC